MAIDDVVNQLSADDTTIDFQPASGVEIVIMWADAPDTIIAPVIFDGTNTSNGTVIYGTAADTQIRNSKLGITNTIFVRFAAGGSAKKVAFSGIQIK